MRRGSTRGAVPMSLFDLSGKVALITGSSRGIGKAIAMQMALHGARVVISSRKPESCEATAAQITAAGGTAFAHACHVGHKAEHRARHHPHQFPQGAVGG